MAMKKTTANAKKSPPKDLRERPIIKGKARPHYVNDGLNVMEAARNRMKWLFDEFDNNITVAFSGGKDSTVVMELAAEQARARGVKIRVMFLDQEAEYQGTIDYIRTLWDRPEIELIWYQIPFKLFNATSHNQNWLNVWGEGEEWIRPKEPNSIHENPFRDKDGNVVDRFKKVLACIDKSHGGAHLTGMRAEESPTRRIFLVSNPMYKWATWSHGGQVADDGDMAYSFHPIYDWRSQDIWKAIYENGWKYNEIYDKQYQFGLPLRKMRVSSFSHSQAYGALNFLREAEPETYDAAVRRLEGISTHKHAGKWADLVPSLPYMFRDWEEYMYYLNENLVDPEHQPKFDALYQGLVRSLPTVSKNEIAMKVTQAVMRNAYFGDMLRPWIFSKKAEGHKVDMKQLAGLIKSEDDDDDDNE